MRFVLLIKHSNQRMWSLRAQSDDRDELELLQTSLKKSISSYLIDTWRS